MKGATCSVCNHEHKEKDGMCACGCKEKSGSKVCTMCNHEHDNPDGSCDCGCGKK